MCKTMLDILGYIIAIPFVVFGLLMYAIGKIINLFIEWVLVYFLNIVNAIERKVPKRKEE